MSTNMSTNSADGLFSIYVFVYGDLLLESGYFVTKLVF
jgi:hypothetical protein